jgi:uncharacterized repeat protein (TIGR03803 family)
VGNSENFGTTSPQVFVEPKIAISKNKDEVSMMRPDLTSAKGAFSWTLIFALGFLAIAAPQAKAQSFNVIHTFTGGSDGADPLSGFIIVGGNLYGTASTGGSSGHGVMFKLSLAGEETVLHEFTGGADGASPEGSLVYKAGNFYGTTTLGGVSNAGTVFEVTLSGEETVLYSFPGKAGGSNPVAGLAIDKAGNVYGTTTAGGSSGNGTVFKLAIPTVAGGPWTGQVLYSFGTGSDGAIPVAGVTLDPAGNLYGTTSAGGSYGYGTVFEVSPSTPNWTEKILHHFELQNDGGVPYAGLILSSGSLYGAATEGGGGGSNGGGTVFKLSPSKGGWTFSVLYGLYGWNISGSFRNVLMKSGKLYATTHCDGADNSGTVYELTESGGKWTYNPLYLFTGGSDGQYSFSNLVSDSQGNLYGTTKQGGAQGHGTAFKVTP